MKITEQLPDIKMQLGALNEPPVVPAVNMKLTVPVGVLAGVVVSATVTVQVLVPVGTIVLGLQTTTVEVLSFTTVILPEVPALPL